MVNFSTNIKGGLRYREVQDTTISNSKWDQC